MIVTVTPNPSIDRTLNIPPLVHGAVQRARTATAEAGGKGVNVSRALIGQGHATRAIVPLSASSAAVFVALLAEGFPLEVVPISGEVRMNISLVEPDGIVTKVNEPGPLVDVADTEALVARTAALAVGATWVVGCGSLPPGVASDLYALVARRMPAMVRVAVDADGAALRACLDQRLALIKPNHRELEELVDRSLPTIGDVVAAAEAVVAGGIQAVLVSLGPDGALLVDGDGASHAEASPAAVLNPVGAGDALLAGFLAAGGGREALRAGVAWSLAACRSPGTQMGSVTPADLEAVVVHPHPMRERRLAA